MNFFAISGLLNGIAAIGLTLLVYFHSPQNPRHRTYVLFGLTTGLWSFGYFFWQLSESHQLALFFVRLLMVGAIFIPVTFLHHIMTLRDEAVSKWGILQKNYIVGGLFLLSNLTPLFVADVQPNNFFTFWPVPGIFFHFFLIWWIGIVIYAHYLLVKTYLTGGRGQQQQYLYLLVASSVGFIGGSTNFPLWYGIEVLPYGTILFTFHISLVAYTLLRYHLMDFSVFVERGLSYLAVLFLISQPAYPVLLLAQKSVFGTISYRYSMVQLFVHLLTVAGAYQMRLGTSRSIASSILKGRDASLKTLSQFSTNISTLHDVGALGKEIVVSLGKGIQAQTVILFVLNKDKNQYVQVSDFGKSYDSPVDHTFGVTDALPRYLAIVQSCVVCHELKQAFPDQWKQAILQDMEKLRSEACFPFIQKNQLIGFCMISPYVQSPMEDETSRFVATLVREAALALENALLREEVIRSQETIRHIDRLRSLETMSMGLTQELAQPQASIKAFMQLAYMRKNDEKFLERLKSVLSTDVQRIEQLTKEIRDYVSNEPSRRWTPENLNELIESCLCYISRNPIFHDIKIEQKLEPNLPSLMFKRQDIRQVLFNLLLFHLHPVGHHDKTLCITTRMIRSSTNDPWVQLEVSNRPVQPSVHEVLCASLGSPRTFYKELEQCAHNDESIRIAQDIIQSYGGYIQGYGTSETIMLSLLSLPAKKHLKGSCIPEAPRPPARALEDSHSQAQPSSSFLATRE
ncbi:MAG: hypothetical protein MRJ96_15415 [Nitrospirales bacterium]|nr:hypothetical protein [Nitrospira sp.]MDR4502832.1 hypothetical protein [Nitrospirales bacterium]